MTGLPFPPSSARMGLMAAAKQQDLIFLFPLQENTDVFNSERMTMVTTRRMVLTIVAFVLVFPVFQNSASAAERTVKFKIDGIT